MKLHKLIKIPIYFKIIAFFHENPASIDTPRGVAAWTGENRQDVKKALLKLAELKVLTAHKVSSTTAYSFTRNSKLIAQIDSAIKKERQEGERS
ncbi:MAG: hypothetical protein PHO42_01545 [Candidatus Omnitrophica bacterium]|nr:hypothetical protein [Candidatus Omnitrophota bacterium]